SDATETAIRVAAGRIVARADGFGACHAAATADTPGPAGRRGRGAAGDEFRAGRWSAQSKIATDGGGRDGRARRQHVRVI
ncbi:MAG TPA: hypothetical protein VE664_05500, partial [Actinomycetes bacterium]|nr:hypothetical protein [Actinomycetes bacterium]